jgi:hypothetical protein
VDPVTGTLAISFYDARNDPANARVATYLATSIDGGATFAPETYLNSPQQALDASQFNGNASTSGNVGVTLGPIPDNQSTGNPNADTAFSFGDHQDLAVYGGHVYAVRSGNENGGRRLTSLDGRGTLVSTNRLDILSSVTTIAAGPRVFGQTDGGPVTAQSVTALDGTVIPYNSGTAAGGTQVPNGFVVTFDRPVDINSFTTGLVHVVYRSPETAANGNAPYFGGTLLDPSQYRITPLKDGIGPRYGPDGVGVFNGTDFLDTRFLVTVALADSGGNPIADPVGTYSYAVGDFSGTGTIHDDIRRHRHYLRDHRAAHRRRHGPPDGPERQLQVRRGGRRGDGVRVGDHGAVAGGGRPEQPAERTGGRDGAGDHPGDAAGSAQAPLHPADHDLQQHGHADSGSVLADPAGPVEARAPAERQRLQPDAGAA